MLCNVSGPNFSNFSYIMKDLSAGDTYQFAYAGSNEQGQGPMSSIGSLKVGAVLPTVSTDKNVSAT